MIRKGTISPPSMTGVYKQFALIDRIYTGNFSQVHRAVETRNNKPLVIKRCRDAASADREIKVIKNLRESGARHIVELTHRYLVSDDQIDFRNYRYDEWVRYTKQKQKLSQRRWSLDDTLFCSPQRGGVLKEGGGGGGGGVEGGGGAEGGEGAQGLNICMKEYPGKLCMYMSSDRDGSWIFRQMLRGLRDVHGCGYVHLDIKRDNVMMDDDNCVRLIDFGLSKTTEELCDYRRSCGSPFYMAPELIARTGASEFSDMYSTGILLFMLHHNGQHPHYSEAGLEIGVSELFDRVLSRGYADSMWKNKNAPLAGDLCGRLLKTEASERLSAEEALNHPWMTMVRRG